MDVSTMENLDQLKALAYDQMVAMETAQRNLSLINNRIAQLHKAHPDNPGEPKLDDMMAT